MIYISTGGQRLYTAAQHAQMLYEHGIRGVELSGGLHSKDVIKELELLPKDLFLQFHNYFPPPKEAFVFNLASLDSDIYDRSIAHAIRSIQLAAHFGLPKYSFHAGFRINPRAQDLGRQLGKHRLANRIEALDKFQVAVLLLSKVANENSITILIENNVINQENYQFYGEDPLLLTTPDEIVDFMEKVPSNVGVLLDVAHLNVSAKTLGFSREMAHEQIKPMIRAYHLSENDGTKDSNEPISDSSWFWKYIHPKVDSITLEIYGCHESILLQQYQLAIKKLNC